MIQPVKMTRCWCVRYYRPSDNKLVSLPYHRVMATLFVPNDNNYKYVKFKDGDDTNNKASNLSWVINAMVIYNQETRRWDNQIKKNRGCCCRILLSTA